MEAREEWGGGKEGGVEGRHCAARSRHCVPSTIHAAAQPPATALMAHMHTHTHACCSPDDAQDEVRGGHTHERTHSHARCSLDDAQDEVQGGHALGALRLLELAQPLDHPVHVVGLRWTQRAEVWPGEGRGLQVRARGARTVVTWVRAGCSLGLDHPHRHSDAAAATAAVMGAAAGSSSSRCPSALFGTRLARGVGVRERVVRNKIDAVLIQELLCDHPGGVGHHLVHPPAHARASKGKAALGGVSHDAGWARALPRAHSRHHSKCIHGTTSSSSSGRAAGNSRHRRAAQAPRCPATMQRRANARPAD